MLRFLLPLLVLLTGPAIAQRPAQPATRTAFLDDKGTIRWRDNRQEVALFGANYCLPSACDYRAAGYVGANRKQLVAQDLAHFARLGFDALRLSFWGDYENTDAAGNLIANDHLDLLDYVVAQAKARGVYILLSPIVTYSSQWPDAQQDTTQTRGISTVFKKEELGTNPKAIAAQCNYLRQLLTHVNPYTHLALKDDPAILFVEMINEPWHHSNDLPGSVAYINALVDAVRSTGCQKILFHNISQDFAMAPAMQQSKIQGVSFAWYPSGLNAGHTLPGNYLPVVNDYSVEMRRPELAKLGKIVYEFDSPDQLTGYMYPAMARAFRGVGAQWATMFSYDMLATAPYNLGWQTHFLNLVYTPTKALSALIAGEVMRTVPRYHDYVPYPRSNQFGAFRLSYPDNLGELATADKFFYTNTTTTTPPEVRKLAHVAGVGSSVVVSYEGLGAYFLDKLAPGTWRLEVYPDAVPVDDPFRMPSPGKVVVRTLHGTWLMRVQLPDLGNAFTIKPLDAGNDYAPSVAAGTFAVRPGVYVLSKNAHLNPATLPATVGHVGLREFVCPPDTQLPAQVTVANPPAYVLGQPVVLSANMYAAAAPQSVTLFYRSAASSRFTAVPMTLAQGYRYEATLPPGRGLGEGPLDYCIVVKSHGTTTNFPSGSAISPADWNYYGAATWPTEVVAPAGPLPLLQPAADADQLAFTRIGDNIRFGVFRMVHAAPAGEDAFHLELPVSYDKALDDYTISLPVQAKLLARRAELPQAQALVLHARGVSQKQVAYLTLVENDGTSWSRQIAAGADWSTLRIPLRELQLGRGAMLPLGYPGRWRYWFEPAAGRGGPTDRPRLDNVAWLQISLRPATPAPAAAIANSYLELSSVSLDFAPIN